MERIVLRSQHEIAGAVLTVSTGGGFSVTHRSDYVGFLHASVGDQFNVCRRRINAEDDWLGKYRLKEGVEAILRARTLDEGGRNATWIPTPALVHSEDREDVISLRQHEEIRSR